VTPAPVASGERDLKRHIELFFEGVKRISTDHMQANFPTLSLPVFELQELNKRYRIIRDHSAFCFVDKATGDVLKSASWAAPAKHARGNIYDEHNGLSRITPYGVEYLR
jgi:hypothetical protein